MPNFQRFPKIELHLHLDCSPSFAAIRQLKPDVTEAEYHRHYCLTEKCSDLAEFLSRIPQSLALMQQVHQLRIVVSDLVAQLAEDGVIYAEIRFAPMLHTEAGLSPEEVTAAVLAALDEASVQNGVDTRLILCTLRHFDEATSLATARLVKDFAGTRVVGLDLAADEAGYPLDAHVSAFAFARRHDLQRTAHAGEALGAASVWQTLKHLEPTRIGHGVRAIEDPGLVRHLADHSIHLEVCPGCNVLIDVFPDLPAHPVERLRQAGVALNINTDGRTVPQTTLTREYQQLHQVFDWQPATFLETNLHAARAAFLPPVERQRLIETLKTAYQGLV